jgi:O-antigen ligase
MTSEAPAYGLWSMVVINVAVFAIFAFSFTHPRTARDWRSFGAWHVQSARGRLTREGGSA